MTIVQVLTSWMAQIDPFFKAAVIIAGAAGGAWVWYERFSNRTRVKVRKLGIVPGDGSVRKISFEAENVGKSVTSLEPEFWLVGYSPERRRQRYRFAIEGAERQLPVHVLKRVTAMHGNTENHVIVFLWFMTFHIPLTRGGSVKVRVRNADFQSIGCLRFHIERLCFIWFGWLSV